MLEKILVGGMEFPILNRAPGAPIEVESVTGLSQMKYDLTLGEYASGSSYFESRQEARRNIVFNLKIRPDWKNGLDLHDIRELLYSTFSPVAVSRAGIEPVNVYLRYTNGPDRYVPNCELEDITFDIFARHAKAQVSLLAMDQRILSASPTVFSWASGTGPDRVSWIPQGNASSGFTATMELVGSGDVLIINNLVSHESDSGNALIFIAPSGQAGFEAGDIIQISTIPNNRYIKRVRGTSVKDVAGWITPESIWPFITPGRTNELVFWHGYTGMFPARLLTFSYVDAWRGA